MPHKLLLADDSVTIQRVIELTFADEDVRVEAVSDGDQAIARLQADPPDIVLADVGMPGKDGYEVAAFIKRSPRLSHIPVVLLTGAFEPIDQARADSVGCDGVLAKPFEPQLVIARVRELLASHPRRAAPLDANLVPPTAPATALPAPIADPPPAPPRGLPQVGQLDSYFDRLDAAFTNRAGGAPGSRADAPAPVPDSIDSFASGKPTGPAPDLPLTYASPPPHPRTPAATMTPLAAAPAPAALKPPAADDLVEDVTRRVLERLSDRAVREAVAAIVTEIAERLVREEIERIKASIK